MRLTEDGDLSGLNKYEVHGAYNIHSGMYIIHTTYLILVSTTQVAVLSEVYVHLLVLISYPVLIT